MIDLTSIDKYMITLDDISISMVNLSIKENGSLEAAFNKQLFYLDCTRVYSNGSRAMQTIGYPYRRELSAAIYIAEQMEEALKEQCLLKLIELHQRNIEYEKLNPPVWYDGEKGKKKFESIQNKHPRRKESSSTSAKKEKIKASALRLNLLKINIKPTK